MHVCVGGLCVTTVLVKHEVIEEVHIQGRAMIKNQIVSQVYTADWGTGDDGCAVQVHEGL